MFLFLFLIIIFEILIFYLLKKNKKNNNILIEKSDEFPSFDKKKFNNFLRNNFDKKLGWVRKNNSVGFDRAGKKLIKFSINKKGYREVVKKKTSLFASFGDSYVFCRQVADNKTWQEQISKNKNFNILNYGVGNYALDQALIRYKNTKLDKKTKFVILGFVPETICRVQSYWKHFLEFGNIHGFKPMFLQNGNNLTLLKNPLNKNTKITDLKKIIDKVKIRDRFYEDKFKKNIFKFPYTISFFKNFFFNSKFFFTLLKDLLKFRNNNPQHLNDVLFSYVMLRNIKQSHKYYKEYKSLKILEHLILDFKEFSIKKKITPIILVLPQLMDLKLKSKKNYQRFFSSMNLKIDVIDTTNFLSKKLNKKVYTNDKYGGHLSSYGNKLVSKYVFKKITKYLKNRKNT